MKKSILLLSLAVIFSGASLAQNIAKAKVYSTVKGNEKPMSYAGELNFKTLPQPLETEPTIFIDPNRTFQTMVGIGGAITDASAEVFAKLSKDKQQELLNAYYSKDKGIGYTLARTNMNSCDFSSNSYTYIKEGDKYLKTFDISHDDKYRLPMIQQAIKTANNKLKLFVSPWSPPAFMKDNNSMLQGGKLKDEFKQSWANYYVKYIQELGKRNIQVWGLTVQNEPMAKQKWESCIFTAEDERDFIKKYLGPTLAKAKMGDKKLIAWDHNRDLIYQRASVILSDPEAAKYVWGIGFHWYETWTGSQMLFQNLNRVKEAFPDKELIFTEGCKEKFNLDSVNNWSLGERYGHSMINDFNSGTAAWTDWNILLDENGGPNHVGNYCFAPIHANVKTNELIYTSAYYYIGQFSKFIAPGAKRVIVSSSRDALESTAFVNPDGKIVVVVMNRTDNDIKHLLWIKGKAAETVSAAHSISTYVL
nr:glycoside hydrolase family 30 protein [uncultured Pedobacter sp.]